MMKKLFILLSSVAVITWALPAFADTLSAPDAAIPEGHWWSGILSYALTAVLAGVTALMAWLSKNAKTWVAQKASEQSTKESAVWYQTALNLAGIAVKFAESKYGPDTETGKLKAREAADWLKQRLLAIDPKIMQKTPNLDDLIDGFVGAAYHDLFVVVSPLGKGPALKPIIA